MIWVLFPRQEREEQKQKKSFITRRMLPQVDFTRLCWNSFSGVGPLGYLDPLAMWVVLIWFLGLYQGHCLQMHPFGLWIFEQKLLWYPGRTLSPSLINNGSCAACKMRLLTERRERHKLHMLKQEGKKKKSRFPDFTDVLNNIWIWVQSFCKA